MAQIDIDSIPGKFDKLKAVTGNNIDYLLLTPKLIRVFLALNL